MLKSFYSRSFLKSLNENGAAWADLSAPQLDRLLLAFAKHEYHFEPTNAHTRDIISNSAAAAALGAGVGVGAVMAASAAKLIAGPIGWIAFGSALGGALIGGAIGYSATKYKITIKKSSSNTFHVHMRAA